MLLFSQILALAAILSTGIIYGTDAFFVLVLRPALRDLDDAEMTRAVGRIHRYDDRRLPLPGILGTLTALAAAFTAFIAENVAAAVTAVVAFACLLVWLVLYLRIAAPINKTLRAASEVRATPADARQLQHRWESIITMRTLLQGAAVTALALTLILA